MPFIDLDEVCEEFVTPKHSTAFGRLVTGEQVELGVLRYKKGEGAEPHQHPHEQIFLVLSGVVRATLGGEVRDLHKGQVMHVPPNLLHGIRILEDAEVISAKGIVDGVGHRI
ncbi:Cupin domain protein [Variovorax sp. PBL-H6]|uniref:cupin domain-containing protein n=1 Tax=Variovorax sp. PBL-H6 TaxID=434009 RepID=UPI0013191118|nr:cupin domain-containing protein [Variovorax sp. PBL-H6]VTU15122.1 Cupin domain protein [Variovorax sp. PBL-H6]